MPPISAPNPVAPVPIPSEAEAARRQAAAISFRQTLASAQTSIAFVETIQLAIDSFRASKVRFLLTMLGMVIGSASIILVATLGLTGKQYALDQLTSIGPNKVEILYGGGNISGPDNTSTPDFMTRDDETAVLEQVPGIVASSPMAEFHEMISVGSGLTHETMILGVSPQYRTVRNLQVVAGRFFDDQDSLAHQKVTDMVEPLAIELYGSPANAIGKTIAVTGIPFTVIGVFKESFNTYGQSEISDHTLLIAYPVARYFTGTDTLKEVFFTMKDASMVESASQQILRVIRSRHRATSVYTAATLTPLLEEMAKIADMLTIVLTLGSLITLVVSGVGIMNSMLANVQSRIKEIGIRKALGATRREIRMQFLTEAIFLSLAGGVVGSLIGMAIPFTIGLLTPFKIPVSLWSAAIALATSVIVGVIFGTLPANNAAAMDPVETLKYE